MIPTILALDRPAAAAIGALADAGVDGLGDQLVTVADPQTPGVFGVHGGRGRGGDSG